MRLPNRTPTRRTALKGLGVLSGAVIGGIGGVRYAAAPAVAASVDITGTTIASDDGDVDFVNLDVTDYWAIWDGFDVPVAAVAYRDVLRSATAEVEHVLHDQTAAGDANPVLLEEISSKDDGVDGWGGPGEWASSNPDTSAAPEPPTGPTTAGYAHADVSWRLLSADTDQWPPLSIETPGDPDAFGLNNPDDDTTKTVTLELAKQVWLYRLADGDDPAESILTTDRAGTEVVLMGDDDGTVEKIEAAPTFDINITNEPATTTAEGSGSSDGG